MVTKYAGADFIRGGGHALSELGAKVADLLGQLTRGIYHISPNAIAKCQWDDPRMIEIVLPSYDFATFDFCTLTTLVVLCHDAAIRCQINGCGFNYLRLQFSQRARTGNFSERHPTLEDAAVSIRSNLLLDSMTFDVPASEAATEAVKP